MQPSLDGSDGEQRDRAREAVAQKLRQLPNEAPPPFDWRELQQRMQSKSASGRARGMAMRTNVWGRRSLAGMVGAIVIAVVVLVGTRIERGGGELAGTRPSAQRVQRTQPVHPDLQLPGLPESDAQALLARAASAEQWLADRPDDGALVRVSTHLAVANLEDRIASMDDLLDLEQLQHAHPSGLRALQLRRAQLVDSLAQVRYAEMLIEEAQ